MDKINQDRLKPIHYFKLNDQYFINIFQPHPHINIQREIVREKKKTDQEEKEEIGETD